MSFPATKKLPYIMNVAAKYLAQQAGRTPRISPCSGGYAWWRPFRAVQAIEPNHEYVDKALHNLALFLYSNSPGGVFDSWVDETIKFDERMFELWADYTSKYLPDDRDKSFFATSLRELARDACFSILARKPRSTFVVEFILAGRAEAWRAPRLYVPSMTDVAVMLSHDINKECGFSKAELDLAMEAWSFY